MFALNLTDSIPVEFEPTPPIDGAPRVPGKIVSAFLNDDGTLKYLIVSDAHDQLQVVDHGQVTVQAVTI